MAGYGILGGGRPYVPGLDDFRTGVADAQNAQAHQLQQRLGILSMEQAHRKAAMEAETHPLDLQIKRAQVETALNPAPTRVDGGDRWIFLDKNNQIVREIPKGATPDAVLREGGADRRHAAPSGSSILSAQTTVRGQDMTDARTREEGAANRSVTLAGYNRPQFNADAGGWVVPPAVGGGAPRAPQPIPQGDYSSSVRQAFGMPQAPQVPQAPSGNMQIPPQVQAQRDAEAARIRSGEASGGAGMVPTSAVIPVPGLTPKREAPPSGYRWGAGGNLEAIPGGPASAKNESKDADSRRTLEEYVAARDGLLTGLSGTTTGPFMGNIPAVTTGQQVAEGGISAMAPVLKKLFRTAGEGTFTDRDQELLLNMVPKRTDTPDARREKMQNIDNIISARLGMQVPGFNNIQEKLKELNIPYEPNAYEYRVVDGQVQRKKK